MKSPKNNHLITLFLAAVFVMFVFMNVKSSDRQVIKDLEFSELMDYAKDKDLESVTISGDKILAKSKNGTHYLVQGPENEAGLGKELRELGVKVNYEKKAGPGFIDLFISILPHIIILLVFLFAISYFLKKGSGGSSGKGGGGSIGGFGFTKSGAKRSDNKTNPVRFKDVAGIDEAKSELTEIVDFLKNPDKFQKLGARIPRGVLLVGPPGTGKTLLAKAVAGEAGVPFLSISGSDFVEMFVGVGAGRVRNLFEEAKKLSPAIIFIDEIDSVGRKRNGTGFGTNEEREQTLNQLLVEMDGFDTNSKIILIGATNRAELLDDALLRPGRFDRRVYVNLPDKNGREMILKVHASSKKMSSNIDLSYVAGLTAGLSGAELESIVNEAAIFAGLDNSDSIEMVHINKARDKVTLGAERKSMAMSKEEKEKTAYHEAGHAIVAMAVQGINSVKKVTIIPRGQALGLTLIGGDEDRVSITKNYAEGVLAYALGGRAAEDIIYNEISAGAQNDIEKVTSIARSMVCSWGMSDKFGPINLNNKSEYFSDSIVSEQTKIEIDLEVRKIIDESYNKAKDILFSKKGMLEDVKDLLMEKETIDEFDLIKIWEKNMA